MVVLLGGGGGAGTWFVFAPFFHHEMKLHLLTHRTHHTYQANNNIGYIGAGIVGAFVVLVGGWYAFTWVIKRIRQRRSL